MEEEKTITEKPKKLWDGALKMVKGENTTQLIEQFTSEMTLVAEGLCEDQSKLRKEVDGMITEEDALEASDNPEALKMNFNGIFLSSEKGGGITG